MCVRCVATRSKRASHAPTPTPALYTAIYTRGAECAGPTSRPLGPAGAKPAPATLANRAASQVPNTNKTAPATPWQAAITVQALEKVSAPIRYGPAKPPTAANALKKAYDAAACGSVRGEEEERAR